MHLDAVPLLAHRPFDEHEIGHVLGDHGCPGQPAPHRRSGRSRQAGRPPGAATGRRGARTDAASSRPRRAEIRLERLTAMAPPAVAQSELAVAILGGKADVGIALRAVAHFFRPDFIRLAWERFDLAIRRRASFEPPVRKLLGFARSADFAREGGGAWWRRYRSGRRRQLQCLTAPSGRSRATTPPGADPRQRRARRFFNEYGDDTTGWGRARLQAPAKRSGLSPHPHRR
jgi:hypothetical protein